MFLSNLKKQKQWLKIGACVLATSLLAQTAMAAKIRAKCYLMDKDNTQAVQGVDIHHAYEIASVSKVFTSYWAAITKGVDSRFQTRVFITPISQGVVNVHLEGGWDPYFNRDEMQYLLAQLQEMKITTIKNLTFDENFKFLIDSRGILNHNVPIGHYQLEDPKPETVLRHLHLLMMAPGSGYAALKIRAKSILKMNLPAALKVKIAGAHFLSRNDFRAQTDVVQTSRQLIMKSVPLSQIMKEMNRNSNNYVANLLFESMGGAAAFEKFAVRTLKTSPSEVQFVNGSGDRLDLPNGKAAYNKASCDAVVRMISQFRDTLKQQGTALENIMALAGEDPSRREASTVSRMYGNEATTDALIAKTGTVDPAVTLAGMASTEEGDVYFGFMYGTNGRKSDWTDARNKIRKDVIAMFKKYGNKKEIDYDAGQFLAFDRASRLTDVTVEAASTIAGKATANQVLRMGNVRSFFDNGDGERPSTAIDLRMP